MENKDLSRDFAIIFGIKPEEVPRNSSGNKKDFSSLADQVFSNLRDLGFGENIIQEKPNEKRENSTVKSIKMDKSHRQVFEEQVDELIKHSEMENSKTDENYKLVTGMDAALLGDNVTRKDTSKTAKGQTDVKQQTGELGRYSTIEGLKNMRGISEKSKILPVNSETPTETKNRQQDKYIVSFKDNRPSIDITENMFINLNVHHSVKSLLFAKDLDTGEMICLDISSILSIVKYK